MNLLANPVFVGEGESHALLFQHLDLSLVQANLIPFLEWAPFMRNLGSFVKNGLIETKIWMLGVLVIPEASLLMDFFQLIEEEKMHVFIYANMSICTCMHTFIFNYRLTCMHVHIHTCIPAYIHTYAMALSRNSILFNWSAVGFYICIFDLLTLPMILHATRFEMFLYISYRNWMKY